MSINQKNNFLRQHFHQLLEDSYTRAVKPVNYQFKSQNIDRKKVLESNQKIIFNNWLKARPIPKRQTDIWKPISRNQLKLKIKLALNPQYSKIHDFSITPSKSQNKSREKRLIKKKVYPLKSIEISNLQTSQIGNQKLSDISYNKRAKTPHMHFNMQYFTRSQINSPINKCRRRSYFFGQTITEYEDLHKNRSKQNGSMMSKSSKISRKSKKRAYLGKEIVLK